MNLRTDKRILIVFLVIALSPLAGITQQLNQLKLDSLFTRLEVKNKAMGSIAISRNGKMIYSRSIGFSSYKEDEKLRANENTKYRIGSITKIFTATIILQLIEEGKIDLATTLESYFPKLPYSNMITISNLLDHTSGIPNIKEIRSKKKARTHEEMLKIISSSKNSLLPGEKTSYSNSNYLLLGYIIEKILNQSYEEVLANRILSKIGLRDTYYGHETDTKNNESFPYRLKGSWKQQPVTHPSIPGGSGGIMSTPTDLIRFIEALFSNKLISETSLQKMKPISNDYGMGLVQFEFDTKKAFGHPGGIDRFESVVAYFPEDSLAIAYCSNGQAYPVKDIVIGALKIYFDKEYAIPDFTYLGVKPKDLKQYTGAYSSAEIPLRIIISKHKKNLVAQPAGYPSYKLEAISPVIFMYDEAAVRIEFTRGKNEMKLTQGNKTYHFMKEQ